MTGERELLARTAEIATAYVESLDTRPVRPNQDYSQAFEAFDSPLPEGPTDPGEVIEGLARLADPGLTAMGSGRYFGFVIGGSVPASLAADWLVSA